MRQLLASTQREKVDLGGEARHDPAFLLEIGRNRNKQKRREDFHRGPSRQPARRLSANCGVQ
jgi:hypothetical protein